MFFQIGCTTSTLAPTRSRRSYLRVLSSYVLMVSPHLPQSYEPYEYYEFLFHLWWVCGEPCGRSSMAPSCTCWFIRLCRTTIQKRIWRTSGVMSFACTRNWKSLTSSVPSRWQCSAPKVEIQILRVGDSESTWVLESSVYFSLRVLCGFLSSFLCGDNSHTLLESWSLQSTSALESSVGSWIILLRSSSFGLWQVE